MNFKEGQAVCIDRFVAGDFGQSRILCEADNRVVYCNGLGVYVRDVDDMVDCVIDSTPAPCKAYRDAKAAWLGIIEDDAPPRVKSTYGFYLFGKYKCRERGQWIPCQVAYNEQTRRWSVDVHEGGE